MEQPLYVKSIQYKNLSYHFKGLKRFYYSLKAFNLKIDSLFFYGEDFYIPFVSVFTLLCLGICPLSFLLEKIISKIKPQYTDVPF